jgi:predicted enzyme related to lactoylglutathione lyase
VEDAVASYVIDYFEIPVPSATKSSAFFSTAFGFGSQAYGDDYVEVRDAGVLGGLNGDAADKSAALLIGIRTDDIAAAEKAIVTAGGTITKATYDYPCGKRLFFREPGGTELVVYQPSN